MFYDQQFLVKCLLVLLNVLEHLRTFAMKFKVFVIVYCYLKWNDCLMPLSNVLILISKNHFKTQELPLARIKKIMKQDEEVKMISAEVRNCEESSCDIENIIY